MRTQQAAKLLFLLPVLSEACTIVSDVQFTFFGYPDNSPPGASTAYNCGGRGNVAGGDGSIGNPLTCAAAPGDFSQCETIYIPFLKKYCRIEDICGACIKDRKNGKSRVDIWTGSSTVNGGQNQINCEQTLTPNNKYQLIRQPEKGYGTDTSPLYSGGDCHTDHVYPGNGNKASSYCSTKTTPTSPSSSTTATTPDTSPTWTTTTSPDPSSPTWTTATSPTSWSTTSASNSTGTAQSPTISSTYTTLWTTAATPIA